MDQVNKISSFRELRIWQKSLEIVTKVYQLTSAFHSAERSGITGQMNRAAVSVVANIAEGWGRGSSKSFLMFLRISRGSLTELETLFCVAEKINLISKNIYDQFSSDISQLGRMLSVLIKKIKASPKQI